MLTWKELEQHVVDQRLRKWMPGLIKTPDSGRVLYLLPEVHDALSRKPWPASSGERQHHTKERKAAMRQVLERFVKGDALLHERDLKELSFQGHREEMRGYWEIRSQGRMEETRLFGFFARAGALIGTAFEAKGAVLNAEAYRHRRASCGHLWDALLPDRKWIQDPWPVDTKDHMNCYLDRIEE